MATRFCTNCGQQIPENSRFCINCGTQVPFSAPEEPINEPQYAKQPEPQYHQPEPQRATPTGPKPSNYLVWAILSTIFCCLPFGIVSIVYAAKVDNLWNAGQYYEAEDASRKAKIWMFVAVGLGLLGLILNFVLILTGASFAGATWSEFLEQLS